MTLALWAEAITTSWARRTEETQSFAEAEAPEGASAAVDISPNFFEAVFGVVFESANPLRDVINRDEEFLVLGLEYLMKSEEISSLNVPVCEMKLSEEAIALSQNLIQVGGDGADNRGFDVVR